MYLIDTDMLCAPAECCHRYQPISTTYGPAVPVGSDDWGVAELDAPSQGTTEVPPRIVEVAVRCYGARRGPNCGLEVR